MLTSLSFKTHEQMKNCWLNRKDERMYVYQQPNIISRYFIWEVDNNFKINTTYLPKIIISNYLFYYKLVTIKNICIYQKIMKKTLNSLNLASLYHDVA